MEVNTQLYFEFDMNHPGVQNFILGMQIKRDQANMELWLNQRKYFETTLRRFNMQECKLIKVLIPVGVNLCTN